MSTWRKRVTRGGYHAQYRQLCMTLLSYQWRVASLKTSFFFPPTNNFMKTGFLSLRIIWSKEMNKFWNRYYEKYLWISLKRIRHVSGGLHIYQAWIELRTLYQEICNQEWPRNCTLTNKYWVSLWEEF